jgi:hypothetical protein
MSPVHSHQEPFRILILGILRFTFLLVLAAVCWTVGLTW